MAAACLSYGRVTKRFGGLRAIDDVEPRRWRAGEFHGIIGPNGAGKTTLLNLVTGYLAADSGSILLDGAVIEAGGRHSQVCRAGVARTFQVVRPFGEMSVLDNVMTGALFSRAARPSLADVQAPHPPRVGVDPALAATAPLAGCGLTLGEKKRLELARALATQPRLLLLDEVMGGLASQDVDDMMDVVRDVHRTGTDDRDDRALGRSDPALAERVTVLNFGRKLFEGEARAAFEHDAVVEAYLGRPLDSAA